MAEERESTLICKMKSDLAAIEEHIYSLKQILNSQEVKKYCDKKLILNVRFKDLLRKEVTASTSVEIGFKNYKITIYKFKAEYKDARGERYDSKEWNKIYLYDIPLAENGRMSPKDFYDAITKKIDYMEKEKINLIANMLSVDNFLERAQKIRDEIDALRKETDGTLQEYIKQNYRIF